MIFSKAVQTIEQVFTSDEETPVCYTYSTNYNMRKARGYKVVIFGYL